MTRVRSVHESVSSISVAAPTEASSLVGSCRRLNSSPCWPLAVRSSRRSGYWRASLPSCANRSCRRRIPGTCDPPPRRADLPACRYRRPRPRNCRIRLRIQHVRGVRPGRSGHRLSQTRGHVAGCPHCQRSAVGLSEHVARRGAMKGTGKSGRGKRAAPALSYPLNPCVNPAASCRPPCRPRPPPSRR